MTDKAETAIGDEVSEDRRRLSYQTGFGDFCFDSARMREKRYESVRGNFQIMKLKSRASPSSKLSQVGVSSREGNGDVTRCARILLSNHDTDFSPVQIRRLS